MLLFKLIHKFNKLANAFDGHCVVDGCAHTTNRAVTLKVCKACGSCFLNELSVDFVVFCAEGNVQHRTAAMLNGVGEELGVSAETVRQMEIRAVRHLRAEINSVC